MRTKYSLPLKQRKFERWLRRAQHDHCCIMDGMKFFHKCWCIWQNHPNPFIAFWTCDNCVHKSKAVFPIILKGLEHYERKEE